MYTNIRAHIEKKGQSFIFFTHLQRSVLNRKKCEVRRFETPIIIGAFILPVRLNFEAYLRGMNFVGYYVVYEEKM